MSRKEAPEICPVCGEPVPASALACPECGSDHLSGWREDADSYAGLDLPEADFNYEQFVAQEFGTLSTGNRLRPVWWMVAVVLLVALILIYLFARS